MTGIDINGKFLGAILNGVHRTAAHYARELIRRAEGRHRVRLLSPRDQGGILIFPNWTRISPKAGSGQGKDGRW